MAWNFFTSDIPRNMLITKILRVTEIKHINSIRHTMSFVQWLHCFDTIEKNPERTELAKVINIHSCFLCKGEDRKSTSAFVYVYSSLWCVGQASPAITPVPLGSCLAPHQSSFMLSCIQPCQTLPDTGTGGASPSSAQELLCVYTAGAERLIMSPSLW